MNNNIFYKNCKWLCVLMLLAILDIGIKYCIKTHFLLKEKINIVPGISLCYEYNSGIAFGLFSNINIYYLWMLIYVTICIIVIFCINLYKSIKINALYESVSYAMMIGGALGNLYDRMLYGVVVDFIDLYIGTWHWPLFNIADVEIFVGMLCLIIRYTLLNQKICY